MKGIYLAAYKSFLDGYDLDYCDIVKTSEHITNIFIDFHNLPQKYDFKFVTCSNGSKHSYLISSNCQGGSNVDNVLNYWLEVIHSV